MPQTLRPLTHLNTRQSRHFANKVTDLKNKVTDLKNLVKYPDFACVYLIVAGKQLEITCFMVVSRV
jgi:hypothetical protein